MIAGQAACLVGGVLLWAGTTYDLVESVVLPRPAVGRVLASVLVVRALWRCWGAVGRRLPGTRRREAVLGAFGPLAVVVLLLCWAAELALAYGLVLHACLYARTFGAALYLSASALLTFGMSGLQAVGPASRLAVSVEAANGLGLVALVVSLLFLLFGAFERREVQVITLDAVAGAPPSGLHLLETCAQPGMAGLLDEVFDGWRLWAAHVLESHLAFPVLVYFRSSHDNEAWLNSLGAVMDAANLALTTLDGPPGRAELCYKVGKHLVDDLGHYFRYRGPRVPGIERAEFEHVRQRLRAAGYAVRDGEETWRAFAARRAQYMPLLHHLARYLELVAAPWIGDRSYLPHRDREG